MTLVLADWLLVAAGRPAERGWGVSVVDDAIDYVCAEINWARRQ